VAEHPARTSTLELVEQLLTIGVFARRSRLSPKALRLYDRLGLLVPAHVDEENGYRRYRESQLETARLVALLRRLDMPLADVAEIVDAPDTERAELVRAYWESVERRAAFQRELVAHLRIRLSGAEGSFDMYEIHERDIPEQLVLTEQRHVRVPELSEWLPDAIGRLVETAEAGGGVAAPVFVIFHGEVNEDSDGPVEVCVPVEQANGSPSRVEPAHREAYTRITKAQVEYPQILSAYDAVAQWIETEGRSVAGSPREVYFTDWNAAGPTDEVCDIAFPVS
jgi:DNA-binding transcriptional MerR regulator/effector-binding domain-containing protein